MFKPIKVYSVVVVILVLSFYLLPVIYKKKYEQFV